MNTLLLIGIAMGAGLLMSRGARAVKLPNVTAFLVAGLIIGPCVAGILSREQVASMGLISDAALGFIAYAIGGEFSHVLWLDSDMVFNDSLFDDLYESGKDFTTGIFHARRPGHQSCIFKTLTPPARYKWDEYPAQTFLIGGCGMAATLVSTEVLKAVRTKYGNCFTPAYNLGEDLAFCKRASELGFEIWAEPCAVVGHIGHLVVYPEDEGRYQNKIKR